MADISIIATFKRMFVFSIQRQLIDVVFYSFFALICRCRLGLRLVTGSLEHG